MRHGNKLKSLNRTDTHRKAMLANMTCSLIMHKRITTTVARAKALRVYAEPLLNRSKEENNTTADQTMHQRRTVMAYLKDKEALKELFGVVGTKLGTRPGGYTRVLKLGKRQGDSAEMAIVELVDFNELLLKDAKPAKKTRRRGGKKTGADKDSTDVVATDAVATDAVADEKPAIKSEDAKDAAEDVTPSDK